jgi:putative intracellular protease/amidase
MKLTDVESGSAELGYRAVIVTADKFEDLELLVPYLRLLEAGVRVDIAAPTMEDIGGEHGLRRGP